MAGERTSVYLAAAVQASGTPLAELIRRGLTAQHCADCADRGSGQGHRLADRRPRLRRAMPWSSLLRPWPALMPVLAFRPVCPMPWSAA
jgi:hypothetical protein